MCTGDFGILRLSVQLVFDHQKPQIDTRSENAQKSVLYVEKTSLVSAYQFMAVM